MRVIANILWFIFTGLWAGIGYFIMGIAACISIIGIPFGLQYFKFSKLSFCPFGKKVTTHFGKHPVMNVIWLIFGGFFEMLSFFILGVAACVTIIGIPVGIQEFKLAKLAFAPFGSEQRFVSKKERKAAKKSKK